MANVVKCSMCPMLISSENPSTFFDHVRLNHRNTGKFHVVCKYPDCLDEYNLYISFKRHWYKNHGRRALVTVPNHPLVNHDRDGQLLEAVNDNIQIENLYRDNNIPDVQHNSHHHVIEKSLLSVNDNDEILERCEETIEPVDEHRDSTSENSTIMLQNPHREIQLVKNAAPDDGDFGNLECWEAGILLLLRQRYFLPFDALQEVSVAIHEYYEMKLEKLKEKLSALLKGNPVIGSQEFQDTFLHLRYEEELTRHRIEASWKKYFPCIIPKAVILNPGEPLYDWVNDYNLGQILDEVFETGYIIPFLESLQQFLSIREVFESVMLNFASNNSATDPVDHISDVWDGSFVKRIPLYVQQKGAILCFQIYMDEVELSNPLGSKKGKHKVSVFYWVLMNLPPSFRSSLHSIQLLGIVNSELLKQRGVDVFLRHFLDDLIILHEGVTLNVRGEQRVWFGILLHFSNIFCKATGLSGNLKYRQIAKIKISGRICQSGTVFLRKLPSDENHALFFRISDAISCERGTFLIMEQLTTCSFCHDRLVFIVQPKKSFVIVSPDNLSFNVPLHSFFYCHDLHVIPNYYHML
ncbi:uncharacterized protein LOC116935270 [Daphnia magna]|nr:uncharacterized protein LOC116935270 [Daphnia magna]